MAFTCIHCRSEIDPNFKACPYCGEPITDFLRRHLDVLIDGKYQILARLGVGGMGEVYKALHVHLNAIRVLKLMRTTVAADPAAHDRFVREARLATKIHHPNVAALHDFSTLDDGTDYMVWEYIEGRNLHELIETRGPLSPRYAASIAVDALLGLEAIHRAGIVHRDISPENIMIARDEDGEEHVKLIDLGIAKTWGDEAAASTQTGMFVGKWKYCSPEHLGMLAPGERIDGRADVYSFGIVLYEMLTGVPPFQADTPHQYLVLHSSQRPRALVTVNPNTTASPELEALLFRALEKDRADRFAGAREFAHALQELLPSLDDTPGAPPPLPRSAEVTAEPTRAARPLRPVDLLTTTLRTVDVPEPEPERKSAAWWIAAAVVLLALIGGSVVLWNKPAPPSPLRAAKKRVVAAAVVPPPRPGHLAIDAFPWGEIASVRNMASGKAEAMQPAMTPATLDLAPGRYEITLTNPAFAAPIVTVTDVRGGENQLVHAQFADPASAKLPAFQ